MGILYSYTKVDGIQVKLPNGKHIVAEFIGVIHYVTCSIILNDILYLPLFNITLISIGKLAKDLTCSCLFSDEQCLIHVMDSRMVGLVKLNNEIYHLEATGFESKMLFQLQITCNSSVSIPSNLD